MIRKLLPIGLALLFLLATSPARAENPWSWSPKVFKLEGQDYTFEWAVPSLRQTPGDTANWQKLLDRKIADDANVFVSAFEAARREDMQTLKEYPDYQPSPWGSEGGYKVVWCDPRHLVLLWHGYDYRGGAHGLPVQEVTVLSTEQPDSLLPPNALFQDEAAVLQTLSDVSRVSLENQFPQQLDEWAVKGTEPTWSNYSVVYPSYLDGPARFEVIFPAYQVAPYALGTPTVVVPWEALSPFAPSLQDGVPVP